MKVINEHVKPDVNSSIVVKSFSEKKECKYSYWHSHDAYEIIYVEGGSGTIHVGSHFSFFEDGQFVLLGPNIPHYGLTMDLKENYNEIIIQIPSSLFQNVFFEIPELKTISNLLEKAKKGISFSKDVRESTRDLLNEISHSVGFNRIHLLLELFQILSLTKAYTLLDLAEYFSSEKPTSSNRLNKVIHYIEDNYNEQFQVDVLAEILSMTVPSFCRFFKKSTSKTVTQFINEFRISKACEFLNNTSDKISTIGFETGFNNVSHFNKQFKSITKMIPKEYRDYCAESKQLKGN